MPCGKSKRQIQLDQCVALSCVDNCQHWVKYLEGRFGSWVPLGFGPEDVSMAGSQNYSHFS